MHTRIPLLRAFGAFRPLDAAMLLPLPDTSMLPLPGDGMRYAFMLPTATAVATACQLCGVGGAALFSPIFLLVFPLMGPEYPLDSAAEAIASALLTEVFGFASGLSGYARRGLVVWEVALQFAAVAVPCALVGAFCAGSLAASPSLLRAVYAMLMLCLASYLLLAPPDALGKVSEADCALDESVLRSKTTADGLELTFRAPPRGSGASAAVTGVGSFLTGLLGVGVGEVVLPQLVRSCCSA